MFETVITSSVLIVIILLIRKIFKGRISNTLRYALWLLVAVRLLLPFSLVKSPVSVLNLIAKTNTQAVTPTAPSNPDPIGDGYNITLPEAPAVTPTAPITPAVTEAYENIKPEVPSTPQPQTPQATPKKAVKLSPLTIAKIVWLSAMCAMILWYIIANTAFYINLRRKRKELNFPCKLKVYAVAGLKSPCLFGLINPAVYVTEEATLDAQTLDCITAHELCHYRHGDMIWATLRYFLLAVYWFNPFVWAAAFVSKKDCEYACDEAAIRRLGEEKRFDYGKALVAMVPKSGNSTSIFGLASTAMSANGRTLKSRVEFIAKKPKTTIAATVMAVIIALFSVGCTFTAAKGGEPSRDVPKNGLESQDAPPSIITENADNSSVSYEKIVYWQTGDPIGELSPSYIHGLFQAEDSYYYAENGSLIPVKEVRYEPHFTTVYGEDCCVAYIAYVDDEGEIKADFISSADYIQMGRYGSRIYFSDDIMLYCYDIETDEVTNPLPSAPYGFSFEDYPAAENPFDINETVTWYSSIRQIGDKLFYCSDKSVSPDGSSPAYEWGIWVYNMATGEEEKLYKFVNFCPETAGTVLYLLDENTIMLEASANDRLGYTYYIADMSSGVNNDDIELTEFAEFVFREGKGVKDSITLPARAWNVRVNGPENYLFYIEGDDYLDGGEVTVIEISTHKKHIFQFKGEFHPNYIVEQDGRLALHNIKGDCDLYVLDTNDDTMTIFESQPGERQFFENWEDGEIRVLVRDAEPSDTVKYIRYEGIKFTSN